MFSGAAAQGWSGAKNHLAPASEVIVHLGLARQIKNAAPATTSTKVTTELPSA